MVGGCHKCFAPSYKEGDIVVSTRAGVIGKAGATGRVVSVNQDQTLTVRTNDKDYQVNIKDKGQYLSVYKEKQLSFSQGDRIVFLKNDKGLNVKNGQTATVNYPPLNLRL